MVADRLGVRRADADVDQADAAAARRDQVIGGRLVPPPRAVGDERGRVHPRLVDIEAAGPGERWVAALPDLPPRPCHSFFALAGTVCLSEDSRLGQELLRY